MSASVAGITSKRASTSLLSRLRAWRYNKQSKSITMKIDALQAARQSMRVDTGEIDIASTAAMTADAEIAYYTTKLSALRKPDCE